MNTPKPTEILYFVGFAGLGGAAALALITPFTIGPLLLLPIVAWGIVLMRRPFPPASVAGAIAGVSVLVFALAYLNRDGPGNVCTYSQSGGEFCQTEWNPVAFIVGGLFFIAVAVEVFMYARRPRPPASMPPGPTDSNWSTRPPQPLP
jgi:hypothetical protein